MYFFSSSFIASFGSAIASNPIDVIRVIINEYNIILYWKKILFMFSFKQNESWNFYKGLLYASNFKTVILIYVI